MLYKHILLLIFINLNVISLVYGNSKPQCTKCLYKCCNSNFDDLKSCKNICETDHCDGIDIDIEDYNCPIPSMEVCHKCLNKCCKDSEGHKDFHDCTDTCNLKDCKNLGYYYECEKLEIVIVTTPPICTECLTKCCNGNPHKFGDCSTTCSKSKKCKNIDFNHEIYKEKCGGGNGNNEGNNGNNEGNNGNNEGNGNNGNNEGNNGNNEGNNGNNGNNGGPGPATKGPGPGGPGPGPGPGPDTTKGPGPDPGAKDPGAKDPAAKDPAAKDPAAKDPAAKDPAAKDPAAKDPGVNPLATPVAPTPLSPPSAIPKPENPLGPVPPFPPQEITTCTTSDDPVCSPPGSTPTVVTYTQPGVETPTPLGDIVNLVTTQITSSIYVPSYTTTNSLGQTIIAEPSILLVIQNIAVTEAPITTVKVSDSTILHDFNSHGIWGVTMSIVIVTTTLIFMVIT
ncbi:autotransporter outer membrane beta-barrel domain-containing protein [Rhizophagus irregularis DAOM 181602=DAOM 197198]|nr:autotransporter outer membrane beta-barrel domain-containing protein [Rhizophagus irregularis DAOM 181602=DAOM 197198]